MKIRTWGVAALALVAVNGAAVVLYGRSTRPNGAPAPRWAAQAEAGEEHGTRDLPCFCQDEMRSLKKDMENLKNEMRRLTAQSPASPPSPASPAPPTLKTCNACQGSGASNTKCVHCKGVGRVSDGRFQCNFCVGKGYTKCPSCKGEGKK